MEETPKKKVDESWKERVEKKRVIESKKIEESDKGKADSQRSKDKEPQEETPALEESGGEYESHPREAEASFSMFLSGLGMQALMCLGEIPNPVTNKKEKNLNQAKYIIDTIGMLKEKTGGNLTGEEANMIDSILYELHRKYVTHSEKE